MSIQSKLPVPVIPEAWNSKEAWRVFGIMSEFVSATERLNQIHPAVSIFGRARNQPQTIAQTFQHFFARKVIFWKFASAYVVMPGGFGTLDELMEALTLVQTGKTRKMPIILVGSQFWGGLIEWFRTALLEEKVISPEDMDLVQVIDEPESVVSAIFKHYETRGFEPSEAERERQLHML